MNDAAPLSQLGRYEIVERLSSGGMGEVFLARFAGPGGFMKAVAVKRIHPHLANDESFVHMLHDEANLASMVRHPNIVATIDVGSDAGNHFLVLEYVPGDALGRVYRDLKRSGRRMPPWVAVWIGTHVASALAAAHTARSLSGEPLHIVHRDVSLSNILLSDLGHPMLFDFGVAKASQRIAQTTHGELKGKLAYMAPETFHGAEVTYSVDIFSLGVVLHELLSGSSPFQRQSDLDTIKALQSAEIAAPTGGAEPELDAIVLRAMARDRAARTPSAEVLAHQLRTWALERRAPHDADSVAKWYRVNFSERVEARQALLARVADRAPISVNRALPSEAGPQAASAAGWPISSSGRVTGADPATAPLPAAAPLPATEVLPQSITAGTTAGVARPAEPVAPKRSGKWLALAAASLVVGGAVAGVLLLTGDPRAPDVVGAAASAASSTPATAAPAPSDAPSAEPAIAASAAPALTATTATTGAASALPVSSSARQSVPSGPRQPAGPRPSATGKPRGPLVRSYE